MVRDHNADSVAAVLIELLSECDDMISDVAEDGIAMTDVASYTAVGVMTTNAGLVLRLADGAEYQITVVRSR